MLLCAGKCGSQEDRNECKEGGKHAKLGQRVKCSWERAKPANESNNDAKADRPTCDTGVCAGHGVEIFGAYHDMQALDELSPVSCQSARSPSNRLTVLLSKNMTAVAHQAQFLFQNSIWPISHTSRTSGCRRQNSHRTSELNNRKYGARWDGEL